MSRSPPQGAWRLALGAVALMTAFFGGADTSSAAVRGVVLDTVSGKPIEDVAVGLLAPDGRTLATASTDSAGRFLLGVPRGGVYRVRGARVGYREGESEPVTLGEADTVAVELHLQPTPFLLDTVQVNIARARMPPHTGEQLITGKLIDAETDEPIPYGTVRLLWRGRSPVVTVLTRNDGTFGMVSPHAGTYELRAEGMGYKTTETDEIYLLPGDTLDVTLRLGVDAVPLDPLTVNVSSNPWTNRHEMVGLDPFFERYARFGGSGYSEIMTRDSLKQWQNKVQSTGAMLQWATPLVRLADPLTGEMTLTGSCSPMYYLNGTEVPYADVQSMSPVLLEGVEVYVRPAIPAELARDNPCGVVAYWSRQTPPDKLPPNKIGRKLAIGVLIVGLFWLAIKTF